MNFDIQYIFNLIVGALTIVGGYLFNSSQSLDRRVQRLEDVQGSAIDGLKQDIKDMEIKLDKLTEKVNQLASNVHAAKNAENQLTSTLTAILKYLEHEKNH
ncbi:MAG: hypothetical protein ACK574_01620 [Bacteroidota bacterium]|jgi:outer membrane murein-binding lipoprotein Lpp